MAKIGRWSTGAATAFPTTSWAAPTGLIANEERNDGFSYNAATSTITLPASPAKGYLIRAQIFVSITHNNRCAVSARMILANGTGSFSSGTDSCYARNSANNQAEPSTWAFIDSPSASAEIQLQWIRDTGAGSPAGSVITGYYEIIEFSDYSDIAMYQGSTNQNLSGTTPVTITLDSTVLEGSNITRTGNVVTMAGQNKRYLVLSSYLSQGRGGRTQRWVGHAYDGTLARNAMSCIYYRDSNNDLMGASIVDLIETNTSSLPFEFVGYQGDGVSPVTLGGCSVAASSPSLTDVHVCIIELTDTTECLKVKNDLAETNISTTSLIPVVSAEITDFIDASSFSVVNSTNVESVQNMDSLIGANAGASYQVSTGTRVQKQASIALNGTPQDKITSINYGRGDQGSQDCWGYSLNVLGSLDISVSDAVALYSVTQGGNSGEARTRAGWVGMWGINLDTLGSPNPPEPRRLYVIS